MYYNANKSKIAGAITLLALAVIGIVVAIIVNVAKGGTAQITYSDSEHSATITIGSEDLPNEDMAMMGQGHIGEEVPVDGISTVEEVDSGKRHTNMAVDEEEASCPVGEECGQGMFIYAPTADPSVFKNYVIGQCFNTDASGSFQGYGAQCWDLADVYWQNTTGRRANTCGTGAAKGMIADGCWQKNAGDEFNMIWNPKELQYGDWLIMNNGQWGHIAMAVGSYNDGYITVLGQNQGGEPCEGGGAAANIINLNLKNFAGAFRYKRYEKPVTPPIPAKPEVTEDTYVVKAGDTLGQIAIDMGWFTEGSLFGDDGYTQKLAEANGVANRGLIYPGQVIHAI